MSLSRIRRLLRCKRRLRTLQQEVKSKESGDHYAARKDRKRLKQEVKSKEKEIITLQKKRFFGNSEENTGQTRF